MGELLLDIMATTEWSAAIKAEDPLGFHDKSSPEEVAAAREAGRAAFEKAENPFAPQWTAETPDPKKMKELYANLGGGEDGRPMDPKKLKEFMEQLHPSDPWRQQIEAGAGSILQQPFEESEPPIEVQRPDPRREHAEKNAGEAEGGANGRTWRWEQTSKDGESDILVRFALPTPATKKDVKVVFKAQSLKVTVAGEALFDGRTYGNTYPDESTWSLVERTESGTFAELQVLISLAEDVKWHDLCAKE